MKTLDLKQKFKQLYLPTVKTVEVIKLPRLRFAMIDGAIEQGRAPGNSPGFQDATQAIYGISFTLKFMIKKQKRNPIDYPVMPLEGLWWVEDGAFDIRNKDNWFYTLIIMQPDVISQKVFEAGLAELRRKRGDSAPLGRLRLETFAEGLCLQILHVGPYADEPTTVDSIKTFARDNGYDDRVGRGGKHHETYLGDPRNADPARLKTVLRHPVERIS